MIHNLTTPTVSPSKMAMEAEDYDSDEEIFGPSIDRYGEDGLAENLIGLTMEMNFVSCEEACRGVVKSCIKDSGCGDDQIFQVIWTCGDDPTEYSSKLCPDDIIGWHIFTHNQEYPTWFDERRGTESSQLFRSSSSPPSSSFKLINFRLPADEVEEYFPFMKDDPDERWWATLNRLTDPDVPPTYFGGNLKSYPLSLLLTIIVIFKESMDPSTILPLVIAKGNVIFKLTDQFTRSLSGKPGMRAELAALHKLVQRVAAKVKQVKDDDSWKTAYEHVQALILTLSENFESAHGGWNMVNLPESIFEVCAKIVLTVGGVLLHPPSLACKAICERDKAFLGEHLMAGTFVSLISDEENFDEDHPVASGVWKQLQAEYEEWNPYE
jgi:hypothetical protein